MVENKVDDVVDEVYNNQKELIYLKYNIVNIKNVEKREEELFDLHEYLPNLLRSFVNLNYYTVMENEGVMDTVLKQMGETRKQGREADVIEFINWIDAHEQFHDLLNENNVKKIGDDIEQLQKEYELAKKISSNNK